jgi:ABC-type lipoprotein release transport system permease subunit
MAALLAGVDPADPATFLAAIALCLLMTLLGSFVPGRRALSVDPVAVIRRD